MPKKSPRERAKKTPQKNSLEKYHSLRSRMKTGDVFAFQGHSPGAVAIRQFTKSEYSHVGMVIRFQKYQIDRVFILEAIPKHGVVLFPASNKVEKYKGRVWLSSIDKENHNVGDGLHETIIKNGLESLGKAYDTENIKYLALNVLKKAKQKAPEDYQEFICSELVAYCFKQCGLITKEQSSNITPKEIMQLNFLKEPIELT